MSRKSRGESVTWLPRLVTPEINTAKQEQGPERTPTCSTPAPRPRRARSAQQVRTCGASPRPDRSEYRSRQPAEAAWGPLCLGRRWRPPWLCSRCILRPGQKLCKYQCLSLSATCRAFRLESVGQWVGGWDVETQGEEGLRLVGTSVAFLKGLEKCLTWWGFGFVFILILV